MVKIDGDKLKERYEKARTEYQEHLKRERAKRKKLKAREDTERKIVVGEIVLSLVESGEWPRERIMARLDTYLSDNRQRALFDLPPRDETPETETQGAENTSVDGASTAS